MTRRAEWKEELRNLSLSQLYEDSPRLERLIRLVKELFTRYPEEKIAILSFSLKFMDMVDEGLRKADLPPHTRFDGTTPKSERDVIEHIMADRHQRLSW